MSWIDDDVVDLRHFDVISWLGRHTLGFSQHQEPVLEERMSEVVFERAGLKVIRFCGKYRGDGQSRTRYEISRAYDESDHLASRRMTLSEDQMKALITSDLAADLCHDMAMSLLGMPPGNDYHGHSCRTCADDGPEHAGDHS